MPCHGTLVFIQKILIKIKKCEDHKWQVNQKCTFGAIFGRKSRVVEYSLNPYLKMSLALAISTSTLFLSQLILLGVGVYSSPLELFVFTVLPHSRHLSPHRFVGYETPWALLLPPHKPGIRLTHFNTTTVEQYRGCITSGHNQMPWPLMSSLLCIAESQKKKKKN